MKRYTKFAAIALTAVMTAALATGCQKKEDAVTLTVWGDTDNQAILEESFTAINQAFEEKYPNIKLDYQYSGSFDTINVAVQSDSLPDLFWVQGNKSTKMAELARNGYLLPLDEYKLDASRFPEDAITYATVDGSVYCSYPSFFDYAVIYYNKDIFAKYNLEKPAAWDDFVNAMDVLTRNGEVAMALGGKGDFDRYWLMQAMAPALFNDTMGAIADHGDPDYKAMETGFNDYRSFAENGYFGKDFASMDAVAAQLAFTNGKAAMTVDGTWNNQLYKDAAFEVGRFAIPGTDGSKYAQSGPSNYNTYAVAKKTKYPAEAVKYVEFLNSKEAQQILEDHLGAIPLVKDLTPKDETVGELAEYDVVGYNIYHVLSGVADEVGKPQDIFLGEVLPKLMLSEMTGEEAVQRIQEEIAKSSAK